jgi:hypothetical protein
VVLLCTVHCSRTKCNWFPIYVFLARELAHWSLHMRIFTQKTDGGEKTMQWTRVTANIAASTDVPMPSEHGQSATRLHSRSSQHHLTSSTPRAVMRTLFCVPTSSRVFTPVSVLLNELRAASSSDVPLGMSPSSPLLKPQIGSCIQQNRALTS